MYSFEIERIVPQGQRQTVVLLIMRTDTGVVKRYEIMTDTEWTSDSLTQQVLEAYHIQGGPADLGAFLAARERGFARWQMDVVREAYQTLLLSGDVDQALAIMTSMFAQRPTKQQELLALEQAIASAEPEKVTRLLVRFMYLSLGLLAGRQ